MLEKLKGKMRLDGASSAAVDLSKNESRATRRKLCVDVGAVRCSDAMSGDSRGLTQSESAAGV